MGAVGPTSLLCWSAVADWNNSHIFNQRWPSHARFHGVVALTMTSTLASLNLWSIWSDSTDQRTGRLYAAAIPVGYWAPILVAPLVRGTGVDDPPHPIPRVAGVPTQPAQRGGRYPHGCGWLAAGSTYRVICAAGCGLTSRGERWATVIPTPMLRRWARP